MQPFGAGGTNKIHSDHVKHTGAEVARQAAGLQHHQRKNRQHQVRGHLQDIAPAAVIAAGVGHSANRQPVQIHGEPLNQQQTEEKGWKGHRGKDRHAHQVVKQRVWLHGGDDTHRQADAPVKNQRNACQQERVPDVLV